MPRWHATYRRWVLARQYRFARERLAPHFFDALTAYALGLARLGVEGAWEAARALRELRTLPLPSFTGEVEDVFFSIYVQLEEHWGREVAGAVRRGLSRNDLDMTVFRSYLRDRLIALLGDLVRLRREILRRAREHRITPVVIYTHHRPAQPTALGHYLLGVESLLARDFGRLLHALSTLNRSPLGASALAGSPYPVDRAYLAQLLGFEAPVENTLDAVAAGDHAAELAAALSLLGSSLSRFVRDLLFWAERGGFLVGERVAQGSSAMPQKHNPVVLEHVRVYAGRLLGGVSTLLALVHNTPFTDLNDHSTGVLEPLDELMEVGEGALELLRVALEESTFVPENLVLGLEPGLFASEAVDLLVRKGLPLEEAYARVRRVLPDLLPEALGLSEAEGREVFSLEAFLERRRVLGGAASSAQEESLRRAKRRLREDLKALAAHRARLREARRLLSAL
ncbi:lyase family protein [Thermus filiformis]|uniref:argininosuccinate lyase n=1 Tax=Thermus filiformis TaxID=276 RepID=A0A0D6XB44_THEFI|nr:lyase family protein [Thermus filiformis]KIX84541.1 argininosuccinate lyase [Thermus filiformis]